MFQTKPMSAEEFWLLFKAWISTRLTAGAVWQPHGWSDWAALDFQSYILDHAMAEMSLSRQSENAAPFDLLTNVKTFYGINRPTHLVINKRSSDIKTFVLELAAHSPHQHQDEFFRQISASKALLEHGTMDDDLGECRPAVIAITANPNIHKSLLRDHHFGEHLVSRLRGAGPGGASPEIHVSSLSINRQAPAAHEWRERNPFDAPDADTPQNINPFAPVTSMTRDQNVDDETAADPTDDQDIFGAPSLNPRPAPNQTRPSHRRV